MYLPGQWEPLDQWFLTFCARWTHKIINSLRETLNHQTYYKKNAIISRQFHFNDLQ